MKEQKEDSLLKKPLEIKKCKKCNEQPTYSWHIPKNIKMIDCPICYSFVSSNISESDELIKLWNDCN